VNKFLVLGAFNGLIYTSEKVQNLIYLFVGGDDTSNQTSSGSG
jgi:hypothetical protein